MSKMLQVRNVPDDLHRRLKSRAALAGTSMSDYVLREIRQSLEKPAREELLARMARLPPIEVDPPPSEVLRAARERR
ncbi:FitA-like ribbon-helix-helix domain-containing protein [Candidatus Palauibacter sp.]|uniref:FitA-like ribbon-helix-helix domain-containing protein n=1 Tax=Candidatus Palauibacter sp. TaxID=3101350 RepID=UPI003B02370E